MKKNIKRPMNIIKNLVIWVVDLIILIPLILVIINSLKDKFQSSYMGMDLPTKLHFENFSTVINEGKLFRSFFNSMLYAGSSVVFGVILASMAAYVLSRNKSKFNKFIYFFIVLGITMPINYVSLTKIMQITHLMNTQIGICLLYTAMQIPFSVFLIYGFISTVP